MRKLGLLALAVALSSLADTSPAKAVSVPLPIGQAGFSVTSQHEPTFRGGNPFAVSGYVYAVFALPVLVEFSHGAPNQSVDILVDGARKATVPTQGEGYYQASFFLSEEQTSHTIQAVIFRGTAAEVRSPLRTVNADQVFTDLWVDPTSASVAPGSTTQIRAWALDGDGRERDVTALATWTSSDTGVASVSGGLVTGHAAGSSEIAASYGGQSATSAISVTDDGRG